MYHQILVLGLFLTAAKGITVGEDDVTYYLYTRSIDGTQIDKDSVTSVNFNSSKDTIFAIHGWTYSYNSAMPLSVKSAYLESRDFNVILVDWSGIAGENYITARYAVSDVGVILGSFIQYMVDNVGLSLNKTGIVGFSLGAHVAGNAGRTLNGAVNRLIGLDPAGPFFGLTEDTLSSSNAQFVQVIHTCAGAEGTLLSMGHADYWVNNGGTPPQPGCSATNLTCSHNRSFQYYCESLTAGPFTARLCSNSLLYTAGSCNNNAAAVMGDDAVDRSQGNFHLSTNNASPYAKA